MNDNDSDSHSRDFTVPLECDERTELWRYVSQNQSSNKNHRIMDRPRSEPPSKYSFLSGIHPELDEALNEIQSPKNTSSGMLMTKSDPRRRMSNERFSSTRKMMYSDTKSGRSNVLRKDRINREGNMNHHDEMYKEKGVVLRGSETKRVQLLNHQYDQQDYDERNYTECNEMESVSSKPKEITCRSSGLNESIDSLPFSLDGMERAKRRIKSQAEKIRDLEAKLEKVSVATTEVGITNRSKVMSPEERLEAHKQRKRQENKYKEVSGKWEAPPPLKQESLTTKVKRKDKLVERLVTDPKQRKRHDQINRRVTRSMKRLVNATTEAEAFGDEDGGFISRRASAEKVKSKKDDLAKVPDKLMRRLNMNVKERRGMKVDDNDLPDELKRTLRGHKMDKKDWRMSQEFQVQTTNDIIIDEYDSGSDDDDDGGSDEQKRCETCFSAINCEEDVDNPGIYYCRKCWEEYENGSEDQVEQYQNAPPVKKENPYDDALWIIHDNPKLGEMLTFSGKKKMSCLIETKDPTLKNCVRILRGMIEYCGSVSQSGLGKNPVYETDRGSECIRVSNIEGFKVDHGKVETRLAKNKAVYEFKLDPNESVQLTGKLAEMKLKDFFSDCVGSVDVILAPQCSPGSWYPHKEATSTSRKIAPQFRSNGFGYIRLGDDMGNNGLAFLSSDSCQSFFSTEAVEQRDVNEDLLKTASSFTVKSKFKKSEIKQQKVNSAPKKNRDEAFKRKLQKRNRIVSDSDSDSDVDSLMDSQIDEQLDNTPDAGTVLKELQNLEVSKDVKWKEKADLLTSLGKAILKPKSRAVCSNALNYIQDIVSAKNVNVNVLRSALLVVEKIGLAMNNELVYHIAWKTIFIEILKLLKNKQVRGGAKEILRKLHGQCFTLGNSMIAISHVLGMGKTSNQRKSLGSAKQSQASKSTTIVQKGNNVEVIEWLAITTENERNMVDVHPLMEESGLSKLSSFFASHDSHRDAKCRKNALDGLFHTVLYGIDRLGMEKSEALGLCIELKDSSPRSWARLTKSVNLILKERMRSSKR